MFNGLLKRKIKGYLEKMAIDEKSSYYDAGGIECIKIIKAKLTEEQFSELDYQIDNLSSNAIHNPGDGK